MANFIVDRGLRHETSVPSDVSACIIVLAVKPQILDAVLPLLKPLVAADTVLLSIAAGKTLATIEAGVGPVAVVRSIPNTPALVGRGITGCIANARVTQEQLTLVSSLLSAVGMVEWVKDEALIDVITAVSGSGPAYVFHMVEALAAAGRAAGLDAAMADRLARSTVEGAGELLFQSSLDPATLRQNVTSPKGTTAAALEVLMGENGLTEVMTRAVAAAAKRSRELAG
eukprot:gene29802-33603_t